MSTQKNRLWDDSFEYPQHRFWRSNKDFRAWKTLLYLEVWSLVKNYNWPQNFYIDNHASRPFRLSPRWETITLFYLINILAYVLVSEVGWSLNNRTKDYFVLRGISGHRQALLIFTTGITALSTYEPSREKTNSMASAKCIDPDQPAQSAQANPGRHISSEMDRGIE